VYNFFYVDCNAAEAGFFFSSSPPRVYVDYYFYAMGWALQGCVLVDANYAGLRYGVVNVFVIEYFLEESCQLALMSPLRRDCYKQHVR